jgi:hypothetical protein
MIAIASSTRRAHRPSLRIIIPLSTSVQNIRSLCCRLRIAQAARRDIRPAIAFSVNSRVNFRVNAPPAAGLIEFSVIAQPEMESVCFLRHLFSSRIAKPPRNLCWPSPRFFFSRNPSRQSRKTQRRARKALRHHYKAPPTLRKVQQPLLQTILS